jgi:hypothetical protein
LLIGCNRPPAVEFENLPLVASLRTACSARNHQWLSGVERAVALRHEEGRLSAAEKTHFDRLIARAKTGDWQGAEKQCYDFERAQLNRRRERSPDLRQPPEYDDPQPSSVAAR